MSRWILIFAIFPIWCCEAGEYKVTGIYATPEPPKVAPVPVPQTKSEDYSQYQPWYEVGAGNKFHDTSDKHLMEAHGVSPDQLSGLNSDQKNRLHGKMHGELPKVVQASKPQLIVSQPIVQTQQCPNGNCPVSVAPMRSRRRR